MSNQYNEAWVEAAHENFQDAVSEGNITLAKDIIQDVIDAGFRDEAVKMSETLREIPVGSIIEEDDFIV